MRNDSFNLKITLFLIQHSLILRTFATESNSEEMKKAMMYLLLALGIIIAVVFVSGAVMGFAAGFIDGYNEAHPGTTQTSSLIVCSGVVFALLACAILNWVFLHFRFASYTGGRMPKEARWRVLPLLMLVMGGLALVYSIMYNPLVPYDGTLNTESDQTVRDYYLMIKNNPLYSLPMLVLVEGTADLILFGAVLREILEWKHKPEIIIPVFAGLMGLFSGFSNMVMLILPSMMVAMVEAWTYECTRSVIPVIIGDAFFWIVMICLLGVPLSGWFFLIAAVIIVPSVYFLIKAMDSFKPID